MVMHTQSEFYYQNGDKVNKETQDKMTQLVNNVMELSEVFYDNGSESVGSFYDKAIKQLLNVSQQEEMSKMVAIVKDYMNRYTMVSSIFIHVNKLNDFFYATDR